MRSSRVERLTQTPFAWDTVRMSRGSGPARQDDCERGAAPGLGSELDSAVMGLDDGLRK